MVLCNSGQTNGGEMTRVSELKSHFTQSALQKLAVDQLFSLSFKGRTRRCKNACFKFEVKTSLLSGCCKVNDFRLLPYAVDQELSRKDGEVMDVVVQVYEQAS